MAKQQTPKYAICIDWETSGATWGGDSSIAHQGLSIGAVVFDTGTLEPVETFYRVVKFLPEKYTWTTGAENIHGMSQEWLAENGADQEDVAAELAELILKYFATGKVMMLGHNVGFDITFTRQLLASIGIGFGQNKPTDGTPFIELHHVLLDTASVGFITVGLFKSDLLFDAMGLETRGKHNALDDALMTLETCKRLRLLVQTTLNG